MPSNIRTQRPVPRREAYYVLARLPDDTLHFFNATQSIGQAMPFDKPQATCAMRVYPEAVAFSFLKLTKRSASSVAEKLELPAGPLTRLYRRSLELAESARAGDLGTAGEMTSTDVLVEIGDDVHRLKLERDEHGIATVEMAEGDDIVFPLEKRAAKLSVYLLSPAVGRVLSIGFIGHLGKPETSETVMRAAAKVLNSMLQLNDFRVLAGIETVKVPAMPGGSYASRPAIPVAQLVGDASFELSVGLFDEELQPREIGQVVVTVDLENANAQSGRLVMKMTPSENMAPLFDEYREILDNALNEQFRLALGAEQVSAISYEIVLGEVSTATVEMLREAAARLARIDATTRQYQPHYVTTPAAPAA